MESWDIYYKSTKPEGVFIRTVVSFDDYNDLSRQGADMDKYIACDEIPRSAWIHNGKLYNKALTPEELEYYHP